MAFVVTKIGFEIVGNYKRKIYAWTATAVTTGNIVHGIKSVKFSDLMNKTGARVGQSIDDTTTSGVAVIAGVTASDTGYFVVEGK